MSKGKVTLFDSKRRWAKSIYAIVALALLVYLTLTYVTRPRDLRQVVGIRGQDVSSITLSANWVEDPEVGMLFKERTINEETIIEEVLSTLSNYTVRKQLRVHPYSPDPAKPIFFHLAVFFKPDASQIFSLIRIAPDARSISIDNTMYSVDGEGIDASFLWELVNQATITD